MPHCNLQLVSFPENSHENAWKYTILKHSMRVMDDYLVKFAPVTSKHFEYKISDSWFLNTCTAFTYAHIRTMPKR